MKKFIFLIILTISIVYAYSIDWNEMEKLHKEHKECAGILVVHTIEEDEAYCMDGKIKENEMEESNGESKNNEEEQVNNHTQNKNTYDIELQEKLDKIEAERQQAIEELENKIKTIQKTEYKCGKKTKCSQMNSCDEAYFYLEKCGVSKLDRDKDGIPCEKICGN